MVRIIGCGGHRRLLMFAPSGGGAALAAIGRRLGKVWTGPSSEVGFVRSHNFCASARSGVAGWRSTQEKDNRVAAATTGTSPCDAVLVRPVTAHLVCRAIERGIWRKCRGGDRSHRCGFRQRQRREIECWVVLPGQRSSRSEAVLFPQSVDGPRGNRSRRGDRDFRVRVVPQRSRRSRIGGDPGPGWKVVAD